MNAESRCRKRIMFIIRRNRRKPVTRAHLLRACGRPSALGFFDPVFTDQMLEQMVLDGALSRRSADRFTGEP